MEHMQPRRFAKALAAALCLAACAPQQPLVVDTSFAEQRPATRSTGVQSRQSCRVYILEIKDERRSPELLGVVAGRAVRAPENVQEWMRNTLTGLSARGVVPEFGITTPTTPTSLALSISLQLASVTNIRANKSANVQFSVTYLQSGTSELRSYRGMYAATNWASGDGELQRLVDRAFGKALDQLAADILGRLTDSDCRI